MNKFPIYLLAIFVYAFSYLNPFFVQAQSPDQPNIIIIFTDDMGHETPHLPTHNGFDSSFGIPCSNDMENSAWPPVPWQK